MHRPASEAICASTDGRGGHGGSSGYYHSGISTSAMASSGGFGATGHAAEAAGS